MVWNVWLKSQKMRKRWSNACEEVVRDKDKWQRTILTLDTQGTKRYWKQSHVSKDRFYLEWHIMARPLLNSTWCPGMDTTCKGSTWAVFVGVETQRLAGYTSFNHACNKWISWLLNTYQCLERVPLLLGTKPKWNFGRLFYMKKIFTFGCGGRLVGRGGRADFLGGLVGTKGSPTKMTNKHDDAFENEARCLFSVHITFISWHLITRMRLDVLCVMWIWIFFS